MERRSFIRQSGLFTAGLLLHQQMLHAYSFNETEKIISIGIIGCGDRGKGLGSVINNMPEEFQLKAVCDVLPFRLDQAKILDKKNNIKYEK